MKCRTFAKAAILLLLLFISTLIRASEVRIAAASSLQFALDEVIADYTDANGRSSLTVVYGSSGNLFRQIMQGAPFDLFLSARGGLTSRLLEAKKSADAGAVFGAGRLVLLSASPLDNEKSLADILKTEVLNNNKLAIANPAHAPYGRAAKQALESLQLWSAVQSNIVNGEQVSQATRFVVTGAAPYGLVSLSLAVSPAISSNTDYLLVDESLHEPIELRLVKLDTETDGVQHLYSYLLSSRTVDEIFKRYGLR